MFSKFIINPRIFFYIVMSVLSFIDNTILCIWILSLLFYPLLKRSKRLALESLIWIQFRSLLNSEIAVPIEDYVSVIKLVSIIILSIYIITHCCSNTNKKIRLFSITFWIFIFFISCSSLLVSSYPVVSILKVLSYAVPFYSIVLGVIETDFQEYNILFSRILGFLLLLGTPLYFHSIGYVRNGYTYQGIFNHPNVYGAMIVLFFAYYFNMNNKFKRNEIILTCVLSVLLLLSSSRTSIFAFVVLLIMHWKKNNLFTINKMCILLLLSLFVSIGYLFYQGPISGGINGLHNDLSAIIYKGHNDSLFYSRQEQFNNNINRFMSNPWLGTGFNVPYIEGHKSFELSIDKVVENGNIVLALLGDVGIIGTLLFFLTYRCIFRLSQDHCSLLFWSPFLISLGEMSFFSTNNFGIIFYFCFSVYIAESLLYKKSNTQTSKHYYNK